MVNASGLLGVFILARHGDRLEFFQDPLTYNPSQTLLTPLGTVEEAALGNLLQDTYLQPSSPSAIDGIAFPVANLDQLQIRADAAGEGSTILSSVGALLSGLFPPTPDFNITLANGTTIVGAGGGTQFLPVESVEPNEDISLNSFTSCPNFDLHTSEFYNSSAFKEAAAAAAPFLSALAPFLDGRSTDFINMIFDFVNVNNIHNATFHNALPATFVEQAYGFANFHEDGVFSDSPPDGIGNVAIRSILPSMFTSLQRIANSSDPLKLALDGISYKPFISFFNLTTASADVAGTGTPEPLFGIVDYASSIAVEVNAPSGSSTEPFLTFKFKNGTSDASFHPVTLGVFGANATSVPLSTFVSQLQFAAINSTAEWCKACNQTSLRGCSTA
ncbi:phosphoglycerate mutase-like protein [Dentipellis sp. KUC8613]|nr:phosphoglycerate mutase-like protein [Dentipellis sp. KUC8613]